MTGLTKSGVPFRTLVLFPQLTGHGGIQLASRETAAALDEIACATGFSYTFLSLNDPPGVETLSFGGRQVCFRGFGRNKMAFSLIVMRLARRLARDIPTIIVAFHPNLGPLAQWAARFSPNAKVIVVSHGVDVCQPLSRARRRALIQAMMVIGPSTFTCEALCKTQGVPQRKTRLLHWALNSAMQELANSKAGLSLPAGFPQGRVILSVARWSSSERYKGADDLISAVAALRQEIYDLKLVLAGGGDDIPRLKELVSASGAKDCVHFLGDISDGELGASYARADIFSLPSTGEGFGFVFLEAMAFGKPVIAASAGGATDIVKNNVNGLLVPPGDLPALKDSLSRLLRYDSLRIRLGLKAEETVRRDFSFSSFVGRVKALLQEAGVP